MVIPARTATPEPGRSARGALHRSAAAIVLLTSLGAAAPSSAAAQESLPGPADPSVRRITVSFEGTPVRRVLSTFAEFSGHSIVAGAGVSGRVTAEIRNQPWDVALQAILEAYGLSAVELESGIIRVDVPARLTEREGVEPLTTRVFRLSFLRAADAVSVLQAVLSERGKAAALTEQNAVVVTDVPRVLEAVEALLKGTAGG